MFVVVLDTKDQILPLCPAVLLLTRCSDCRGGEAHVSISGHRELTFTLRALADETTES